jgi:hypothetical protein
VRPPVRHGWTAPRWPTWWSRWRTPPGPGSGRSRSRWTTG